MIRGFQWVTQHVRNFAGTPEVVRELQSQVQMTLPQLQNSLGLVAGDVTNLRGQAQNAFGAVETKVNGLENLMQGCKTESNTFAATTQATFGEHEGRITQLESYAPDKIWARVITEENTRAQDIGKVYALVQAQQQTISELSKQHEEDRARLLALEQLVGGLQNTTSTPPHSPNRPHPSLRS